MKTGINEAILLIFAMGAVIFFCRIFPFLFLRREKKQENAGKKTFFLSFVEKAVPPAAMTVLAFNSITGPLRENIQSGAPMIIAVLFTALMHLWRRNPLISIFGGTALYMALLAAFS